MASVLPDHKLSKSKFLNWIKAALAVHFTKEEIEPVVQDEIEQFQRRCLQDICTTNGLPAGSICTTCNTENVIVCPTDRICNDKRGKCKYHRNFATQYRPSGCPNNICHHMKSEIQKAHRFHGPSYKNTDATKWCNDTWEIAKCYLPPDGYTNASCAAETDFNGIISVIINHKELGAKISDDLSKKANAFDKGRDVGKAVRHSPNLEVEDTDLTQYFIILKDILSDPGFVAMKKSPNKAILQALIKLQTDELVIGKDVVRRVLEDVGKAIQEQIRNEIDEYKYKTEKQKLKLIDIVNLKVKDIEDKRNVSITQLNDALKSCVDVFDARVQTSLQEIDNKTQKGRQILETVANEGVKKVTKEAENVIKEVQKAVVQTPSYTDVNDDMLETIYQKRKKELKEELIKFYKWAHSKVLLSPLFEEKDTPLASFYMRPELNVNTLQEMFKTEGVANREIYLKADAGLGKTTFSKYLATSWYQAHCPDEKDLPSFEKNDIDCMRDFDFVFLVLLRDSYTSCSVDELIHKLIVSNLANTKSFTEDFLGTIMSREKCLVILDGLDEWTHPNRQCERAPRSIPHRNVRENCTILTTTRPWKLGDLNLSSNELGKTIELTKLSYNSAVTLIRRSLKRLKSPPHNMPIEIDDATLEEEIFDSPVAHLAYVPLLLMYMICLRCEGFNIGNSKCELYVKIVELLLIRTTQKYGDISQMLDIYSCGIPACFAEHKKCKEYFTLLMHLGQLAYYTLTHKTRENMLVFEGSITEKYLTTVEMEFTLHSGILSKSTTTKLTTKVSKVSFSHKTVQEFIAAIFISSHGDAQKIVLEKCRNIQDILDLSKVCEFTSEMNADRVCELSNDLMSVINEDEETRDYRTAAGGNISPLYKIQEMFMSCLQEMHENENIQLCLQDFFINKYNMHSKQLQCLLNRNKTNIKSLHINNDKNSISLRKISQLLSLTDLSHIQKLNLHVGILTTEVEINRILSKKLARLQNLQYLYIKFFTLSKKIVVTFFNFISGQKSIKKLTLIWLDCKVYGYHDCKSLNLDLSQHSMKKSTLKWLKCKEYCQHNCKKLHLDLSQHSTLSELVLAGLHGLQLNISTPSIVGARLSDINLDESSLLLSRDMLNIERVELEKIEMSAESLQNFITVLENLPHSVTVMMRDIQPQTVYEQFQGNIMGSQLFRMIEGYDYDGYYYDSYWFVFETMKERKRTIEQLTEEISSIKNWKL